jgi:predicted RNase H-like HicB family nuclease
MEKILIIVEKTETGYSAYSEDVLGCVAVGGDMDQIKLSMLEAIEFHLEGLKEFKEEIPEKLRGEYSLDFKLDIQTFFEWFDIVLSQTGLSKISGINRSLLSRYANDEKTKPSEKQLRKLESSIHKFGAELQSIHF